MRLTEGTRKFWVRIILSVLIDVAIAGLLYVTWNWIAALVFLLLGLLHIRIFLKDLKARMSKHLLDEWDAELVDVKDGLWVGKDWLEQQTRALEVLGFQHLQDFRMPHQPTVARCMSHSHHHCFAEMFTVCNEDGEIVVENMLLGSLLTDGWSIIHVNRDVDAYNDSISCLWRIPKVLSVRQACPTVEALLNAHLEFRDRMQRDLGLSVIPDVSWETYVQHEQDAMISRKQAFRQTNLLVGMFRVAQFELNPQSEWLGDYGKKLKAQGKLRTS